MKKYLLLALVLVSVLALSACGEKDSMKIGFASSTFDNPFFKDIEDGILEVLADSEYELVSLGADNDASVQAAQIEDLIAQGVDLILLNPVDSTTVGTKILEANEAGIPVITVDRNAETGEVIAHVASDNVAGGKMAATELAAVCPTGTPVLQITGQAGASAATDRQAGFEEIFGTANIDHTVTASWSRAEGQAVTEAFLATQTGDKVCVFAANDEMALGAVEAIKANTSFDLALSFIIGFDAIGDAVTAVNASEMHATVAQQPVEIGRVAAQIGLDYLAGETVAASVPVELALIKKD